MSYEDKAFERLHAIMMDSRSVMSNRMEYPHRGVPIVLHWLVKEGESTPSELAKETHNTLGRISAILSAMEKKGWITRDVDPDNRRRIIVRVTKEGEDQHWRKSKEHKESMRWIFEQMGEESTEEFLTLMERFVIYMSLRGPGDPAPDEQTIAKAFAARNLPYPPEKK
ncbi:MarR family winged helix-turn-helix transcriptional regulator [Bifidobacterium tsurumiense]|uniref:Transcriptional regulator, MarR family n=1 Tax=Bifidobacterium tsurumiense TaxID=356829 RepID=A0A087ECS3_9BIFI|nr:transcriptional regulator [Bifidobacterium tsurumiense]KFJ05574.1 transcriptional regulator, MarR family [Bifidobacterium tsurumiense]MDY4678523.1 transcriptional regulator [Bifidobacterium tsurumiense]